MVASLSFLEWGWFILMVASLSFLEAGWSFLEIIVRWGHLEKICGSVLVTRKTGELTFCEHSFLLCSML